MGAQTSKVARKLPTKARPETLKNVPTESPTTLASTTPAFAESKTELIEEDGRDPQLHEKLKSLGPVTIQPTVTKMRTSDTMLGIIKKRNEAEQKEIKGLTVSDGLISIDSLFTLLEQRKRLNPGEIDKPEIRQALLKKYEIDEPTLSTLLNNYNTMSIMPPAIDDKEERRVSVWITDKVDWETQVRNVHERNEKIKKERQEAIKDNNRALKQEGEKEDQKLKDLFDESY